MTTTTTVFRSSPIRVATAALWAATALLNAQPSLQIASPASGASVQLGQTLNITVTASGTFQLVTILSSNGLPNPQPEALASPPYQFSISIPSNIQLGTYYLTAVGALGPGQGVSSPQVPINIVGNGIPTLTAQPASINFDYVGDQAPLVITAQFPNGPPVIATKSFSTTYLSVNTSVATVNSQGIVTAAGPGST